MGVFTLMKLPATEIQLPVPASAILREISPWLSSGVPRHGLYVSGPIQTLGIVGSKSSFEGASPFFGYQEPLKNEELFKNSPALRQFLDELKSPILKARILTMGPGAEVKMHRDPWLNPEFGVIRINVPLIVTPESYLNIEGKKLYPKPGQAWFIDTSFMHGANNPSKSAYRSHLVLDVGLTPYLHSLFPKDFWMEKSGQVESFSSPGELPSILDSKKKALIPESLLPLANPGAKETECEFFIENRQVHMKFKDHKVLLQRADDGAYFPKFVGPGFKYFFDSKSLRIALRGAIVENASGQHSITHVNYETNYLR